MKKNLLKYREGVKTSEIILIIYKTGMMRKKGDFI